MSPNKSKDPHLRWKGEEDKNPVQVSETEWFLASRGVWRASLGVEGLYTVSTPTLIMARRNSNKMTRQRKTDPVPLTLSFTAPLQGDNYIDLSMVASAVSRKFFRQGLDWAVSHFTVTAIGAMNGTVTVSKCPQSWVASNGWHKAMEAWKRQQDEAMEEAGGESLIARFRDFKIHLDTGMVLAPLQTSALLPTAGDMLLPYDNAFNLINVGEWDYSQIVIPNLLGTPPTDPKEFYLHMVGPNVFNYSGSIGSRGIIEGYADSRSTPHSPDPVGPDVGNANNWLRNMFDVGNDSSEITDNAQDENNDLPYDQVNYPGGENNFDSTEVLGFAFINNGTETGIGKASLVGSNFPCGLIKLSSNFMPVGENPVPAFYNIQVHLVPGTHRGYLASSMQDM